MWNTVNMFDTATEIIIYEAHHKQAWIVLLDKIMLYQLTTLYVDQIEITCFNSPFLIWDMGSTEVTDKKIVSYLTYLTK